MMELFVDRQNQPGALVRLALAMTWLFVRLARARRGATAIEFALVAMILVTMMGAIIEFGSIMFVTTLVESALRDASRFGVTGAEVAGISRLERIRQIIGERTLGLVNVDAAQVDVLVYPSFATVGRGEQFVDGNGNSAYDVGETFTDSNGNGTWDADLGIPGAGEAGQVVLYRLRYDWPLLTPIAGAFIGSGGRFPIQASVVVRNEPWMVAAGGG